MSDQDRLRVTFQDLNNDQSVNIVYTDHDTSAAEVLFYGDYLTPLTSTNLTMIRQDISRVGPSVAAGASGSYPTVNDMCTLEFTAADGSIQPVTFSGPISGIFGADHETVNPAQTDMASFLVWIMAFCTTAIGSHLIEYRRGWRWHLDP